MDLDVIPSRFVSLTAVAGDANAIENNLADFNDNVSPSHPSASHVVNISSLARIDDDRPLVLCKDPTSFDVAGNAPAASSVAPVRCLLRQSSRVLRAPHC